MEANNFANSGEEFIYSVFEFQNYYAFDIVIASINNFEATRA